MIKFKFVGFIISFLTAILVITNGNGSLLQNAFGDSDSDSNSHSVDEIVESAEEESDDVRDDAEDIAGEAQEDADIDGDVRDRDNDEDEDEDEDEDDNDNDDVTSSELEDIEDKVRETKDNIVNDAKEVLPETECSFGFHYDATVGRCVPNRSPPETTSDDAITDLESEIEDKVREVKDNVEEDDIDDIPSVGEGSGMQIFVSPRTIRDIIPDPANTIVPDGGLQGTNPDRIIEGSLNILFPTGGVGASPPQPNLVDFTRGVLQTGDGGLQGTKPGDVNVGSLIDDPDFDPCPGVEPCPFFQTLDTATCECIPFSPPTSPGGVGASGDTPIIFFDFDGVLYAFELNR